MAAISAVIFLNWRPYVMADEASGAAIAAAATTIIAWQCGSCDSTNEDLSRRYCVICGQPTPVRYYIVAPSIQPGIGRPWWGRLAEPIDVEDRETNDVYLGELGDDDEIFICASQRFCCFCLTDVTDGGAGVLVVTCINCNREAHKTCTQRLVALGLPPDYLEEGGIERYNSMSNDEKRFACLCLNCKLRIGLLTRRG